MRRNFSGGNDWLSIMDSRIINWFSAGKAGRHAHVKSELDRLRRIRSARARYRHGDFRNATMLRFSCSLDSSGLAVL